jgi:conjugative relaxase-like TrwC/TraI family protein
MMTINPAASLDYYLATVADADGVPLLDKQERIGAVGYYNEKLDADPLARPGHWFGRMADSFGLHSGDAVDARTFANLYFGRTPDGRKPLTSDMPGVREQQAASRAKAKAEAELAAAGQALAHARVDARRKRGPAESDIDRDPAVLLARERLDQAKRARRQASGDPGTRQPAHDLAFGAPKDVSLLLMALHAEGRTEEAKAIEQAFVRSVEQTLATIEREFLLDRPRDGEGNRTLQGIAGCAGALFLHFDARPVDGVTDPHLHAHALIFSPVATLDGDVRSVWTKYLSDHQHALGAMQRAVFAGALKDLGYAIEPDIQKKVASFRLQGLDDRQRASFSKRSAQVEAAQREGLRGRKAKIRNRAAKFERLDGRGLIELTGNRLRQLGLDANAITSPLLERRIRQNIVRRMHQERQEEIRGGQASRVKIPGTPAWDTLIERRTATELRRLRDPIPDTAEGILDSCLQMEAWFSVRDIERKIWEAAAHADIEPTAGEAREAATLRWGKALLAETLRHPDLIQVQYEGGHGPQGLDPVGQPVFTTRKQRALETEVYGRILPELASSAGFRCIEAAEANLHIDAWEAEQSKAGRAIVLSGNQRQAVVDLATSRAGLHVVSAWAGAGKTTMASAAVGIMKDMGLDVLAVAPSNAAAEGLRREIGAASALTPESLHLAISNGRLKLTDKTVLYVDEASMLDFAETRNMLLAVQEAGARIIFQGDARQLQAVGMGNVLKRILSMPACQLGTRPRLVSHLTKRFADFGNIQRQRATWAKQVVARAELGHVTRAFDELDRRGLVERHAGEDETLRAAVKSYADNTPDQGLAKSPSDIALFHKSRIMIASTNARVARLNELAREELKSAGLLGEKDWLVAATMGRCLRVAIGERLVFTDKAGHGDVRIGDGGRQQVVKSSIGTVTAVSMRRGEPVLTMTLDDGRRVEVDSRHFGGLDHAYALTIHKSQGMSVDSVDFVGGTFNNAELALVALSRFKERLRVHVAEHEIEALRNGCARVTEKLEANDLHAVDLGFGTGDDVDAFKVLADEANGRFDAFAERLFHLPSAVAKQRRAPGKTLRANLATADADRSADNRLPQEIRERAWQAIETALADRSVLTALDRELGLADASAAKRRWAGKFEDIVDWRETDGGGEAWEVGLRKENGETKLRGVALADDGERIYLAVAINGTNEVADAHTRILAVGKEALGDGAEHLPTGGVMRITVKAAMIKACERLPAPVPEVVAARLSR